MTNFETVTCPSCGSAQRELSNGHFLCDECGTLTPRPSSGATAPAGPSAPASTAGPGPRGFARATSAAERAAAEAELSNLLTERASLVRRMNLLRDGAGKGRKRSFALGVVALSILTFGVVNLLHRQGRAGLGLLLLLVGAALAVPALRSYVWFRRRRNAFRVDSKAFERQLADLDRRIERCEAITESDD